MYILKPSWLAHKDEGRSFEVYSVCVSPDGTRLASGGLDGKIRVWSTEAVQRSLESDEKATKAQAGPVELADAGTTFPGSGNGSSASNAMDLDVDDNEMPAKPQPEPVYQATKEPTGQLCSMSNHSGAVTVVRFSPSGQYLASGSDDRVVLIWELDQSRAPVQEFGATETEHETWTARKRLIGHESDVQDLAWSPDGQLLVTVGLDSAIFVWSGTTFEKLQRIEGHQSHIKGIAFDPANKFFATASDDRTVRITRYQHQGAELTFSTEHVVSTPLQESPLSTYFRRCSWSPDGSHIAVSNATNGPVSTVCIVSRGTWDSDISLVGHEMPCEVACFCPRTFTRTPNAPASGTNSSADANDDVITVVATAAQDKTLAIWNTTNPRPLLVAHNISKKAITDLAWAPGGDWLYASSLDGSICAVAFEKGELGHVMTIEATAALLTRFGSRKDDSVVPVSTDVLTIEKKIAEKDALSRMKEIMGDDSVKEKEKVKDKSKQSANRATDPAQMAAAPVPVPAPATTAPASATTASAVGSATGPKTKLPEAPRPVVTITKEGRKRVAPTLLTSTRPAPAAVAAAAPQINSEPSQVSIETMSLSRPSYMVPKTGIGAVIIGNKRRAGDEEEPTTTVSVGQAKRPKEAVVEFMRPAIVNPAAALAQVRLAVPKVRTFFSTDSGAGSGSAGSTSAVLEIRNSTTDQPTKILCSRRGTVVFTDFVPRHGHLATGVANRFWAVATEDGTIHVYSPQGARLFAPLVVGASLVFLECHTNHLLAVSSIGLVYVWDISTRRAVLSQVSLAPILDAGSRLDDALVKAPSLTQCAVSATGSVLVTLTNGQGFTYDADMQLWTRVSEPWWAVGSQYWSSDNTTSVSGAINLLERRTNTVLYANNSARYRQLQSTARGRMLQDGYESFESVVSVGHLETRLAAARVLDSPEELRRYLVMYAGRLAEEGLEGRLDELCRELYEKAQQDREAAQVANGHTNGTNGTEDAAKSDSSTELELVLTEVGRHRQMQHIATQYVDL